MADDVELALVEEGPDVSAEKEDEEARQFILKAKKTIERCLQQGMDKAEMFRVIREEGLPAWIAFAVFKELRAQNHDFFKEYYSLHDLKKQREKLGRLIQAYRAGGGGSGSASAGARAPETATTAAAMETDTTACMEWSDPQAEQALCDGEPARLLTGPIGVGGGGDQFAGASLSKQQGVHCPGGGQQPHHDEKAVYDERLQETGTPWAEEAVPALAQSSVANSMFQGVAWPQQLAGQQLLYQQEQAGHLPAGQHQQLRCQELDFCFPADQPQRYLEQAVAVPLLQAGQQLHYQQEQELPVMPQLHHQQEPLHLPAEQQLLLCYQDQLMMANGGFQGAPLALVAGLTSGNTRTLSQGGIGWRQEQPAGAPRQRWPGAGAEPSPSSTLAGGEQQQLGNQNFHSSNAGTYERPR